jgi:hypothetical protein
MKELMAKMTAAIILMTKNEEENENENGNNQ